jgi:hypothetical protein
MRAVLAALLVASCATLPPPSTRLAGCWIDRNDDGTATTMRWMPDESRPGVFNGALLNYTATGAGEAERYTLQPRGRAWDLCRAGTTQCWEVAQSSSGSLEGGRAFIDAHGDRLRVSVLDFRTEERIIFSGARDGCD